MTHENLCEQNWHFLGSFVLVLQGTILGFTVLGGTILKTRFSEPGFQ